MTAVTVVDVPRAKAETYLDEGHSIASWLLTTDHKRIGILYAISITAFFFIGAVAIGLVRLELLTPRRPVPHRRPVQPPVHHARHHHGVVLPGAVDPHHARQFPAADDARHPRRRLSAPQPDLLVPVHSRAAPSRSTRSGPAAVDTGWTFYTPFSTLYSHGHVIPAAIGIFIVGFSSIATGVNFITTVHMLRAPGLTWFRLAADGMGALRHQHRDGAGDAGAVDVAAADRRRALAGRADLRPRKGRRSAAVPAPVLVLQPSGRLHHDTAWHGSRSPR